MFFPKFTGKDGKSKIENIAKLNIYIYSYLRPKPEIWSVCKLSIYIIAIFGTFLCDICKEEDNLRNRRFT